MKPEGGGDRDLGRRDPAVLSRLRIDGRQVLFKVGSARPESGLATKMRASAQRLVVLYDVGRLDGEAALTL